MSSEFIVKHDPSSKSHLTQDLQGNVSKKYGRRFLMVDYEMVMTTALGGPAKIIFQIIKAKRLDETPNRRYFCERTGFGKSIVSAAIKELVEKGMIFIRRVPYAQAIREIYDIMPMTNWTWLQLIQNQTDSGEQAEESVQNQSDQPGESIQNQTDSDPSRSEIRPTVDKVDPESDRLSTANPCPATDTEPLLDLGKEDKLINPNKGREGETANAAILSLEGRRLGIDVKKGKEPHHVACSKLAQQCFRYDGDFIFGPGGLNDFMKALGPADMLAFTMYIRDVRDGRPLEGGDINPEYKALRELWEDFKGPQLHRPARKKVR